MFNLFIWKAVGDNELGEEDTIPNRSTSKNEIDIDSNNSIAKEINFYDISSDTSDYKDSSSDEEEETDDDLDVMSDTEKEDNK